MYERASNKDNICYNKSKFIINVKWIWNSPFNNDVFIHVHSKHICFDAYIFIANFLFYACIYSLMYIEKLQLLFEEKRHKTYHWTML